jgi:hypothetical protein
MSIWNLRSNWDASSPTAAKLERFAASLATFGDHASLIEALAAGKIASTMTLPFSAVDERDAIAF